MNTAPYTVRKELLLKVLIKAKKDIANFKEVYICWAIDEIESNNSELQEQCFELKQAIQRHIGRNNTLTRKIAAHFPDNANYASNRWCRLKWIDFFCRELDKNMETDLLYIAEMATEKLIQRITNRGVGYVYHKL